VFLVHCPLQVSISFVKILFNVTRPHTARLGNIPGTSIYRNVEQYPESTTVSGILAIRVDAAIYFSNSNYIHDKILQYLEEEQKRLAKAGDPSIQYLILDLTRKQSSDPKTCHSCSIISFHSMQN
jgi:high affinity sulfate transporter 1